MESSGDGDGDGDAGMELVNGLEIQNLSGGHKTESFYWIDVPVDALNIGVTTRGGTGDVDLYVKGGSAPALNSYDCRSWEQNTNENCAIIQINHSRYYVMLRGYSSYQNVSLSVMYDSIDSNYGSGSQVPINNNEVIHNIRGEANSQTVFYLDVPEGAENLSISTSGGYGDVDLYLKAHEMPLLGYIPWAECAPLRPGNVESCQIQFLAVGRYYIMLHGFDNYFGVTLKAKYDGPVVGSGGKTLINGVSVPILGLINSKGYYEFVVPPGATDISISVGGGYGDVNLYVSKGSIPTLTTYDCRPYLSGNNELCTGLGPGTYYIMLHGVERQGYVYGYTTSLVGNYAEGNGYEDGDEDESEEGD